MTANSDFDAVIFDCDGVLVDSEILAIAVEIAVLAQAGLDYDMAGFKARFMGMSDDAFFTALNGDAQARLGQDLPADFRPKMSRMKQALFAEKLVEVAGARACVARVRQPKAVATSGTATGVAAKLRKTDMWDFFAPHIYSANDVAHAKPAPDLFLHAAGKLGIAPARCLVLEDSVNGIKAARAAGMIPWGFAGGGHIDAATIASLKDAGAARILSGWDEACRMLCEPAISR